MAMRVGHRTRTGWVCCTYSNRQGDLDGARWLYRQATIERAGYQYEDEPTGVAPGEDAARVVMLAHNWFPDKVLCAGHIVQ